MTIFIPASSADRQAATEFVGRVAQLDPAGLIRLVAAAPAPKDASAGAVDLWARGGFGVVATRRVAGRVEPSPLTVYATNLVAALAVTTSDAVDAGTDAAAEWRVQIPPVDGWSDAGELAVDEISRKVREARVVAEAAVTIDRAEELRAKTKATVPPAILDRPLMAVAAGEWNIPISMRMLFALSGMGLAEPTVGSSVRVRVTATWLRLDTSIGSVARRRMADLPDGLT